MKTKSKPAAYFDVPAMNQQAIASQFKEFKTEVADAIRAKKGTTEAIHPKDFAEEIRNIEGGESASTTEYYLFTYPNNENVYTFVKLIMSNLQAFVVAAYFKGVDRIMEYSWGTCLIGGFTNFGENDFLPHCVKAFKVTYIAGASTLIDYCNEHDMEVDVETLPLLGLTPCTKEEYEALITK